MPTKKHRWFDVVLVIAAACGLLLPALSAEQLAALARQVSPSGAIMPKTEVLLAALRYTLPALGALVIAWLLLPQRWATRIAAWLYRALDSRRAVWLVVALGVAIRSAWLLAYPTQLYADSQWYLDRATWLAQGHGYVLDPVSATPTAAWPPGYPWVLGLLFRLAGPNQPVALALNVMLGGLSIWLTIMLGKCWLSRRAGLLAGLAIALLPGLVVYTSLLNSDVLFLCLTLAVLLVASQDWPGRAFWWQAVTVGALLAVAGLTRSQGIALLPLAALARWSSHARLRFKRVALWTALAALTLTLCCAPWTLRNYRAFGQVVLLSTNGGLNFWMGNNPGAGGAYYAPKDPALNPLLAYVGDELGMDAAGYRYGLAFIRENPGRAIALWPAKAFYLYNSNDAGIYWNQRSALGSDQWGSGPAAYWLTNLPYTLLLAAACLGLASGLCANRLPVASILWWTALHLPFFGSDRFALPVLPMFALLAAAGVLAVVQARAVPEANLAP